MGVPSLATLSFCLGRRVFPAVFRALALSLYTSANVVFTRTTNTISAESRSSTGTSFTSATRASFSFGNFLFQFFNDRHYLEKDWGKYFLEDNDGGAGDGRGVSADGKVLLEVGCGAGNTVLPLIAACPKIFVYACDFSSDALALVKPNGQILVRDFAVGDSTQVKLENKNQMISHNYYFRLDGTCKFFTLRNFCRVYFQERVMTSWI